MRKNKNKRLGRRKRKRKKNKKNKRKGKPSWCEWTTACSIATHHVSARSQFAGFGKMHFVLPKSCQIGSLHQQICSERCIQYTQQ